MTKSFRANLIVGLLLLVPAVAYCIGLGKNLTFEYLSSWLLINYFFLAVPHFIMLLASIFGLVNRLMLQITLVVLNLILILFQGWIWLFVPGREQGLAWILYIPAWMIGLLVVYAGQYLWRKRCSR